MEEHQRGSVELFFFFLSLLSVAGESARCARRSRRATELLRESGVFFLHEQGLQTVTSTSSFRSVAGRQI